MTEDILSSVIKENSSVIFYLINCTCPYVVRAKCYIPRLVFIRGAHGKVEIEGKILLSLQGIETRLVEFCPIAKGPYPVYYPKSS